MLLMIAGIIIVLTAGSYLLALVSDVFADGLSRVVESAFDFLEYKAALRNARTRVDAPRRERMAYAATRTTLPRAA
jgi:hypothetical protein